MQVSPCSRFLLPFRHFASICKWPEPSQLRCGSGVQSGSEVDLSGLQCGLAEKGMRKSEVELSAL